ncbi:acyltransferase family protein [Mucilaginibacter pallidiroseus]|uniref:Acyltransferase family protein n=1 Tax=Mucilaginibacter pallidiroseus TaxID=2599295 RepID=A0A563U373_9SPHI|nr:acyltransferase family protein [Mucilaginibacter pallidiroseus]TWR25794.1 acyltransferase family protein [Mucilaginibacter pallidiroseus]
MPAPPVAFKPSPTGYLNLLRIFACFMVLMVHSGEFFYIGAGGSIIREHARWVNNYGSFMRACVPLFVMISGYLLLPMHEGASVFYKKRFTRLLIPFLVWSVLYALIPYLLGTNTQQQMWKNLYTIPINFSENAGHLWFVYMLIGLYLFIPIFSPWVQGASKRFKQFFLLLWIITLFFPYIKTVYPEVLGEAFWNKYHSGYYFSGYIGYLLLGNYLKENVRLSNSGRLLIGALLVIVGYAITNRVFAHQLPIAKNLPELELSWVFPTINVAMMATGLFLMFSVIKFSNGVAEGFFARMSGLTYGMYLAHILVLNQLYPLINKWLLDAIVVIPVLAVSTFIVTYLLIRALSYLPYNKYIVG